MADSTPKSYSTDPALYLYTSLTSGSSHIVTATSRMETILKANKIPFKALDIATDEKARMLWGRRAGKDESGRVRKIPGLVQMGLVIGDIVEVEDWNEYGELKLHIKIHREGGTPAGSAAPTPSDTPSGTPSKAPAAQVIPKDPNPPPAPDLPKASEPPKRLETASKPAPEPSKVTDASSKSVSAMQQNPMTLAMRQLGQEAAQKAKDGMRKGTRITETYSGKGKAEAVEQKSLGKTAVASPPLAVDTSTEKHTIDTPALLQSPTSTAWKNDAHAKPSPAQHSFDKMEALQSPNSTTWKSVEEHGGLPKPAKEVVGTEGADRSAEDKAGHGEGDKEEGDEEEDDEEEDDDDEEEEEDEDDDDGEDDDSSEE